MGRFARVVAGCLALHFTVGGTLPSAWAQQKASPAPGAAAAPAPTAQAGAPGQPSQLEQQAAQQHYQAGVMFFEAQNWSAARAEFEAAYQLTKYPDLLYNLAKIAEKQGRTADEVRYLDEYLAGNPPDAEQVRARLQVIRPATPAEKKPLPWGAIGLLAGGGAALIIGFACGGAALAAADTVASSSNSGKPFTSDLFATQERGKQLSSAAIAFDVIGGVALAAGAGWLGYWLYQRHKANATPPAPKTALIPWGPAGPGVGLVRSF